MRNTLLLFCLFIFIAKATLASDLLPDPPAGSKLAFNLMPVSSQQFDLVSYNFEKKSWERVLGYIAAPKVDSCELYYVAQEGLFVIDYFKGRIEKTLLINSTKINAMRQKNLEYLAGAMGSPESNR